MAERNKFGLSRWIPNDIRREVRQRCGFGCVRCGLAFFDYEHFDPDFADAKEHKAEGITLLCMQCNQKRARGMLSRETVALANEKPRCLEQGFANEAFDLGRTAPIEVVFAGVTFSEITHLIEINGLSILSVKSPEGPSQPYLLSGKFSDSTGEITLTIDDNVWRVGADKWDVECVGTRITIRYGPRDISLILRAEPPSRLVVEKLNMECDGVILRGTQDLLEMSRDGTHWSSWSGCSMRGPRVGILYMT